MNIRKKVLKYWMKRFSRINYQGGPWQGYIKARLPSSEEEKKQAFLGVAQARYEENKINRLDDMFGLDFKLLLEGKDLLEIGSNHGGSSLYYFQNYNLKSIAGVDTTDLKAEVSKLFFEKMGVTCNFHFQRAFAENLPFPTESFDAIISFDVFEHVADVLQSLNECYRVLKYGGKAFIAFPSYYHPTEHHLSSVTIAPCIHWFYSPASLLEIYHDILDENPEYRDRIGQHPRSLKPWEKLYIINGLTLKTFQKFIDQQPWKNSKHIPRPLGSYGKFTKKYPLLKLLTFIFSVGTKIPVFSEFCNHRIVYVLEK